MDVIAKDVCIYHGYRLTEFQLINGKKIIDTFFCIRDKHGKNYDTVDEPLEILLKMSSAKETKQNSA